jgi:cobalt-zinc-cadmium efflux system protein
MRKHEHHAATHRPRTLLIGAVLVTAVMFVAELIGGFWTNSVGLLSDAGHMFMDLSALVFSLVALTLAGRPVSERRTFGLHRLEVFAAFLNGAFVTGVAVWILIESWNRLKDPPDVKTGPMLVFAVTGLIVNLVVAWKLHGFAGKDINIRGAFLHVLSDALASLGVVAAGILIRTTGILAFDPAAGIFVAAVIVINATRLLKESVEILLEGVPKHINLNEVIRAMESVGGVRRVEDTHIWNICSHISSFSAHVTLASDGIGRQRDILEEINGLLHDRFHIVHSTIQFHFEDWTEKPRS